MWSVYQHFFLYKNNTFLQEHEAHFYSKLKGKSV